MFLMLSIRERLRPILVNLDRVKLIRQEGSSTFLLLDSYDRMNGDEDFIEVEETLDEIATMMGKKCKKKL